MCGVCVCDVSFHSQDLDFVFALSKSSKERAGPSLTTETLFGEKHSGFGVGRRVVWIMAHPHFQVSPWFSPSLLAHCELHNKEC